MEKIWRFFIERSHFSYFVLVVLIAAGVFSLLTIPKESSPEVAIPVGIVSTALPGATADEVEVLVTTPVENALLGGLENVSSVSSVSSPGISSVTVEFDANADLDESLADLRDQVDAVRPDLPDDATDPQVIEINFVNQPIYTFAITSVVPSEVLAEIAGDLSDTLEQVSGVSDVIVEGDRDEEVQVVVRMESLSAFNLSISDVVNALRFSNASLPVGSIVQDGVTYNIEFNGEIENAEEIGNVPIMRQNSPPILVRDVADVYDGLAEEATRSRVSIAGEPSLPSLTVSVFKRSGGDITAITGRVEERIEELQAEGELLDSVEVASIYNSGALVRHDLFHLTRTGLETIILVMLVLFLAVGWRAALVAGVSIPISFLIAFIGLEASGNTLNFISLFSLILAVGILVDTGVVIVEGMYTQITRGLTARDAAFAALHAYHRPLTAGILATVAAFVPLFFISGITGEFIKTIPFTIVFVLLASLFVALSFVPIIGIPSMRAHADAVQTTWQDRWMSRFQNWYRQFLRGILENRRKGRLIFWGLIAAFFLALTFPVIGLVQVIFFPPDDLDFVIVEIETPPGTTIDQADLELRKVEEILYNTPNIASFSSTAGAPSQFTGDFSGGGATGSRFANIFINLNEDREVTSGEFSADLRERLSVIHTSEVRVAELSSGPPVGTPIVIEFTGDDLQALESTALAASTILETIPGAENVTTSAQDDATQFTLSIDKERAAALGLTPMMVAQALQGAVAGTEATSIKTPDGDIEIIVAGNLNPGYRDPHRTNEAPIDALSRIDIQTAQGPIALGSVLSPSIERARQRITHEDGERTVSVGSDVAEGGNVRNIVAQFTERAATELELPEGVSMSTGGENEEIDQSFREMFFALIGGVLLMLAVLMFEFNSLRHSLYVLAIVPLTLIGIMVGLALTGNALSFPSLLGFIALSGIIVNHTILLIDVINHLRKDRPDAPVRDLIIEGSVLRLRPITLTNVTTAVGMIPLALAGGLWAPLAIAIMFGLLFAAVITLIFVPIAYDTKPGSVNT
jgi:multidrug efflux pump subunit AcrB